MPEIDHPTEIAFQTAVHAAHSAALAAGLTDPPDITGYVVRALQRRWHMTASEALGHVKRFRPKG